MEGSSAADRSNGMCSAVRDGRKRVSEFLSLCADVKKRKTDFERQIVSKRAEKRRIQEQIRRLQIQIAEMTQKLGAKESVLDIIEGELQSLIVEHNNALE
jgi:hypothetical protein